MEEPGRLQSMGSLRVGHDWMTSLSPFTFMHWRRKWQPTPVFLPRESQRQWAPIYGVAESRTRLKRLSSSSSSSSSSRPLMIKSNLVKSKRHALTTLISSGFQLPSTPLPCAIPCDWELLGFTLKWGKVAKRKKRIENFNQSLVLESNIAVRVLKLYLLIITLTVLKITENSRKSLTQDFSDVSSWLDWSYRF